MKIWGRGCFLVSHDNPDNDYYEDVDDNDDNDDDDDCTTL